MSYVIIGNGVASVGAIEGIRKVDKNTPILVVSEEDTPTYGRPLISYFLAGKIGLDRVNLRPDEFYEKNNVEVKLNTRVAAVDKAAKTITTEAGEVITYEKLLLVTGGVPFMPPIKGIEGSGVFNFTTLNHAHMLLDLSKKIHRVVVIGGGLIGLKAAEALRYNGLSTAIVELGSRVLSAAFDDVAGNLVAQQLEDKGITICCGTTVEEILRTEQGEVIGVRLANGQKLACEAVVVAIGVVPSLDLAKDAGLAVNRGIQVDDNMCSSVDGIYAAGDVAEAPDMIAQEARVTPIWPNAFSQGYHAGLNMASDDASPHPGGLPMNAISFYGLPTASLGHVNPSEDEDCEVFTHLDEENGVYRKLIFRNEKLIGYVLVGEVDFAGLYTGFVRFALDITPDVKEELIAGQPSALLWPEEEFDTKWTLAAE